MSSPLVTRLLEFLLVANNFVHIHFNLLKKKSFSWCLYVCFCIVLISFLFFRLTYICHSIINSCLLMAKIMFSAGFANKLWNVKPFVKHMYPLSIHSDQTKSALHSVFFFSSEKLPEKQGNELVVNSDVISMRLKIVPGVKFSYLDPPVKISFTLKNVS